MNSTALLNFDDLPLFDLKGNIAKRVEGAVVFGNILEFYKDIRVRIIHGSLF